MAGSPPFPCSRRGQSLLWQGSAHRADGHAVRSGGPGMTAGFVPSEIFRHIVRHTPLVSIDLIIEDESGHVLVGLRNNEPAAGVYFVPGGVIRKDETVQAAFRRIVVAETGLEIEIAEAEFLGVFEHLYDTNRFREPGFGTHY